MYMDIYRYGLCQDFEREVKLKRGTKDKFYEDD